MSECPLTVPRSLRFSTPVTSKEWSHGGSSTWNGSAVFDRRRKYLSQKDFRNIINNTNNKKKVKPYTRNIHVKQIKQTNEATDAINNRWSDLGNFYFWLYALCQNYFGSLFESAVTSVLGGFT